MVSNVDLSVFTFNKKNKVLSAGSSYFYNTFPVDLDVISHHTGRVVKFVPIGRNHPQFDEDHWDGEQMVYEPLDNDTNVKTLVIYHGA